MEVLRSADGSGGQCEAHTPPRQMSEEQLKAFLEAVKADAGLQEQLKAAGDADAVAAIAKAAGFVISAVELQRRTQAEISENELECIIGGLNNNPAKTCQGSTCNTDPSCYSSIEPNCYSPSGS